MKCFFAIETSIKSCLKWPRVVVLWLFSRPSIKNLLILLFQFLLRTLQKSLQLLSSLSLLGIGNNLPAQQPLTAFRVSTDIRTSNFLGSIDFQQLFYTTHCGTFRELISRNSLEAFKANILSGKARILIPNALSISQLTRA